MRAQDPLDEAMQAKAAQAITHAARADLYFRQSKLLGHHCCLHNIVTLEAQISLFPEGLHEVGFALLGFSQALPG